MKPLAKDWLPLPEYNCGQPNHGEVTAVGRGSAKTPASEGVATNHVVTSPQYEATTDTPQGGASKEDIRTAVIDSSAIKVQLKANDPAPETTAVIRGKIIGIMSNVQLGFNARRSQVAQVVVEALVERGQFFFHAEFKDFASAMYFDNFRKRLERVKSDSFIAFLSEWTAINKADKTFDFIKGAVESAALHSPHTKGIVPEAYWASRPGAIYVSNGDGQVVKITGEAITLVDNGIDGVVFAAGKTLAAWMLTQPIDPFQTCSLFRDAHCETNHGQDLLRLWIYSVFSNQSCKPPLCLTGDIGSGKTRMAKGIVELLGLPFLATKVEENAEDNFWPSIDQGGIYTLDNADTRCRWLPDALANAATAGCSQKRKLYTNSETVTLHARAWMIVTTATPTFANDAGLADRLLVVRMGRRQRDTSDTALTKEIEAARDGALSHIALMLQKALADTNAVSGGINSRHPDFAAFAVRIGRALNREAEAIAALKAAEADKSAFCLENDDIGTALLSLIQQKEYFHGTAADLMQKLIEIDRDLDSRISPKRLAKRLVALWPHLEKAFDVARKESGRGGILKFTFRSKQVGVTDLGEGVK